MSALLVNHQSRWGWHPCDYATFRKLKTIARVYMQTLRAIHAWRRWTNKAPEHRQGPEPVFSAVLATKPPHCVAGKDAQGRPHFSKMVIRRMMTRDAEQAWQDYRNARRPQPTAEQVLPLGLSLARIEEIHAAVEGNDK